MRIDPEIVLKNVPETERDAIHALVSREIERLEGWSTDIVGARAVVELPHRTHRKGNLYHVAIELSIPGRDVIVWRDPEKHHAHEEPGVAIRDAFRAARRQLEERTRRAHHRVKHKDVPAHGRVVRLEPERGFGFIMTRAGREIYFHRNAVVDGRFDRLLLGTRVRYTEAPEPGKHGPHASTVRIEGRHHHLAGPE